MRNKILALLLLIGSAAFGQDVHTFPALDTNNVMTGSNTYVGAVLLRGRTQGCVKVGDVNGTLLSTGSACVDVSSTQSLTNKTVDGVSPTTFGYLDATSSIQTQLNNKMAITGGINATFTGTLTSANFLLNSTPTPCGTNLFMRGYNANFSPICANPNGGVISFNGRTGSVTPINTDYTPGFIGAVNKAGDTMTGTLNITGSTGPGIGVLVNGSTSIGAYLRAIGSEARFVFSSTLASTGMKCGNLGMDSPGEIRLHPGWLSLNKLTDDCLGLITPDVVAFSLQAPYGSLLLDDDGALTNLGSPICTVANGLCVGSGGATTLAGLAAGTAPTASGTYNFANNPLVTSSNYISNRDGYNFRASRSATSGYNIISWDTAGSSDWQFSEQPGASDFKLISGATSTVETCKSAGLTCDFNALTVQTVPVCQRDGTNCPYISSGTLLINPVGVDAYSCSDVIVGASMPGATNTTGWLVTPTVDETTVTGFGAGGLKWVAYYALVGGLPGVNVKLCNTSVNDVVSGSININIRGIL